MAFHGHGKLPPHPESTHPRVKLADHLLLLAAELNVPAVINWFAKVASFPMLLNDKLGDCTCAGFWHLVQSWTAYAGTEYVPTDSDALALYERMGYNPNAPLVNGENPTDGGAVEQDVLQSLADASEDGHGVVAFAQVDHTNAEEMKAALAIFGGLYVGIQCPESMQDQFANATPGLMPVISYVPGSPIEGGHCIVIVGWDGENWIAVTWGAVVQITQEFWEHYGDEAWVIVTHDFIEKNGDSPTGLDVDQLVAEFKQLPAQVAPVRNEGVIDKIWSWLRSHI
jgi:hypothetical protein